MSESITKLSNEIGVLSSSLLSTLDESIFFSELSTFFSNYMVPCDRMHVFKVQEDTSAMLISQNGKAVENSWGRSGPGCPPTTSLHCFDERCHLVSVPHEIQDRNTHA